MLSVCLSLWLSCPFFIFLFAKFSCSAVHPLHLSFFSFVCLVSLIFFSLFITFFFFPLSLMHSSGNGQGKSQYTVSCWLMCIVMGIDYRTYFQQGIPSKHVSSACADCGPALCSHRSSLLLIERAGELFGLQCIQILGINII